jgi:hypothetical protein
MTNLIGDEKHKATPGRPKGTPNKTTALLKDAIIKAAEAQGDGGNGGLIGYCTFLARDEPKAFAQLLGKVLPLQVTGADDKAIQISIVKYASDPAP